MQKQSSSLSFLFPVHLRNLCWKQPHLRRSINHLSCFGFSLKCWFSFCMQHLAVPRYNSIPRLFALLWRVAIRIWVPLHRLYSPPKNMGLTLMDSKSRSQIQERLTLPTQLFLNPRGCFCIWYHLWNFSLQGPFCCPGQCPHPSLPITSVQWHMCSSTSLCICQQSKDVDTE